jgi:adenylate cyclase
MGGTGPGRRLPLPREVVVAVVITAILGSLLWVPQARLFDWRVYDFLSTQWPPSPVPPAPILVAIDEPSFDDVGRPWPWPRGLHGQLIENLRAAGAKVIALDLVFSEPQDPVQDQLLARALGPDVVLASSEEKLETAQIVGIKEILPLQMFLDTGAGAGNAAVFQDDDGVLRRIPERPGIFAEVVLQRAGAAVGPRPNNLIQYFDPAKGRGVDIVSYYQALDPENMLPPGSFKDRIVIVGFRLKLSAEIKRGGTDNFEVSTTVRTRQLMAGAEVQATILQNLRSGLSISLLPNWAIFLLTAIAAWAGAWINRQFLAIRAILTLVIGCSLVLLDAYLLLRVGRWWTGASFPLLALFSAVGIEAGLGVLEERLKRRRITNAFQHYLSPNMVEMLVQDPGLLKLGGEQRELTILFCDVRGFTSIAEALKDHPERLVALMNRVLTRLSDVVLATGGTIDKYIGDCVMAFWNAPVEDRDHARHAAEAALKMLEAVAALNDELVSEGESAGAKTPRIDIGIGINTGTCIVGNMGSESRFDYSAVGDAVNLASRLESLCKTYGRPIVISEATCARIVSWFETEELDRTTVRGRSEVVTLYTITAAKP